MTVCGIDDVETTYREAVASVRRRCLARASP
jgi:hypothetical protein